MLRKRQGWMPEEMIKITKNQLKELSFSYEKLSQTLKKMPMCHWSLQSDEIDAILGRLSMEACENCERFYQCYRKEKEDLSLEVEDMLHQVEKGGTGISVDIPHTFVDRCLRKDIFVDYLCESYEMIGIHRNWRNKMLYQRKLMASQMEEMARLLFDCSLMMGYDAKKEEEWEKKIKKRLKSMKVIVEEVRFCENTGRKKEVFLVGRKKGKGCSSETIATVLSNVMGVPMMPSRDCKRMLYQDVSLLHFKEDVNYHVLSGMAHQVKDGEKVSGDLFSIFRLEEQGKQICLLADGMGSGEEAREEGNRMVELLEQLLGTGFREEESLRLANSVFTFGVERSMYSSIDLLSFHLYTGLLKIIKSGGAATFLVCQDNVEIIPAKTLPAGILWEVEFDVVYKKLYDGDKVVLVSDGVLESFGEENPEEELAHMLGEFCKDNPQQAAENILEQALLKNNKKAADDMTVLVISVWKKNRR